MSIKFLIACVRLYTPMRAIGFSFANLFFYVDFKDNLFWGSS